MLTKVKTREKVKTWVRPYNPRRLARITTGAIRGLCKRGYGLPVRPVRVDSRKTEVTLPPGVAVELRVKAGDFVIRWRTEVEDVLAIADVSAFDERDVDGRQIIGEIVSVSKVRPDTDGLEITITKEAKAVYGEVIGKFVVYSLTVYPGVMTEKIVECSRVAEEVAKMMKEGLWHWPVLIEDSSAAWRAGFEPFMEALDNTMIQPRYAQRDPRNINRVAVVKAIMIKTTELQAELRRAEQWSSMI